MSSDLAPSLCAYIAARYPERTGVQVRDLVNINAGWSRTLFDPSTARWSAARESP